MTAWAKEEIVLSNGERVSVQASVIVIGKSVEDEVQQKLDRLKLPRSRSVRTVLVYDGELDPTVSEDGFFDCLVPADRLLGR